MVAPLPGKRMLVKFDGTWFSGKFKSGLCGICDTAPLNLQTLIFYRSLIFYSPPQIHYAKFLLFWTLGTNFFGEFIFHVWGFFLLDFFLPTILFLCFSYFFCFCCFSCFFAFPAFPSFLIFLLFLLFLFILLFLFFLFFASLLFCFSVFFASLFFCFSFFLSFFHGFCFLLFRFCWLFGCSVYVHCNTND